MIGVIAEVLCLFLNSLEPVGSEELPSEWTGVFLNNLTK